MVIGGVAAIWPFFLNLERHLCAGLQLVYVFFAFMTSIFMVIALWKIRSFLKERGLGDRLSPLRMLVHAIAFTLYVFVYASIEIATELAGPSSNDLHYVKRFVCIIVGLISSICLFFVLWHLGSKDPMENFEDFNSNTTPSTSLQVDSILRLEPNRTASFIEPADELSFRKSEFSQNLDTRILTQFILKSADCTADHETFGSDQKLLSQSQKIGSILEVNELLKTSESV